MRRALLMLMMICHAADADAAAAAYAATRARQREDASAKPFRYATLLRAICRQRRHFARLLPVVMGDNSHIDADTPHTTVRAAITASLRRYWLRCFAAWFAERHAPAMPPQFR